MAAQHDPDRSFIHGLADFWTAYFQDTQFSDAYFAAGQVLAGQLYLDLLQEVLGTSLEHAPLFSKRYYQLLAVPETELRFVEGASTDDDRYVFSPEDPVVAGPTVINKVIAPTDYLFQGSDYDLRAGSVAFRFDPFDVNGETLPGFAVRSRQFIAPAVFRSVVGTPWKIVGVKVGDTFQYVVQSALPVESEVALVDGPKLVLRDALPEFFSDLRDRSTIARILREPYDGEKNGVPVAGVPTAYTALSGFTINDGTVTFTDPTVALSWVGQYVFMEDPDAPLNSGLYRVNSVNVGLGEVTLARPTLFVPAGPSVVAYLVAFGPETFGDVPLALLPHTYITRGTVSASGRRAVDRTVNGITYPAGGDLLEGIDFQVNYDGGTVTFLSIWDPTRPSTVSYRWRLLLIQERYLFRDDVTDGEWSAAGVYLRGDVVLQDGRYWVCVPAFSSLGTFILGEWAPYDLFTADETASFREIAFWMPDALLDQERLYTNFGYLLGYRRPSSEQYRSFLRGVAQLFLLGPSLARMRSALNVVAGLPVVRSEGEVLVDYQSGYEVLGDATLASLTGSEETGDGGALVDNAEGDDGLLSVPDTFSSTYSRFVRDDIGAILRLRTEDTVYNVTILDVAADGTSVTIDMAVVSPVSNVRWAYRHNVQNNQFRVESNAVEYLFTENDVDAEVEILEVQGAIWISGATYVPGDIAHYEGAAWECTIANTDVSFTAANWRRLTALAARNIGSFRVLGVDGPRTLRLESPFGFTDARGLRWRLTHTGEQRVVTDKAEYVLPIGVPIRDDIPGGIGRVFRVYDSLTDVIGVVDYVTDPTWWHRVKIPQELLGLDQETPGRRSVTPELIPNVIGPVDQAVLGDPGVFLGADDEGNPGYDREGPALWLGGPWVALQFGTGILRATARDVGQHLTFVEGPFSGSYPIVGLGPGDSVELGAFPPIEAAGLTPALPIAMVRLPSLVYRHTVAFVMMDRFLKYHAIHAEVQAVPGLPLGFLGDAVGTLQRGKPGYNYLFVESSASFRDVMRVTESFIPDIGHPWVDHAHDVNTHLVIDGSVALGEYYRFFSNNFSGVHAGGAFNFLSAPSYPYLPDRYLFVYGKFTQGTVGGSPLAIGRDYTFDFVSGAIAAPAMDAGAWRFDYVFVALRRYDPIPVPWWNGVYPGETPVVVGGSNPTIIRRAGTTESESGMIERAIQITIA